tara:strand:+ start:1624 stop:2376 length:753 start_codon:yes stop_codon:yes gene_type:complete
MNYKFLLILILLLSSCTSKVQVKNKQDIIIKPFSVEGFTLIYQDKLFDNKTISKKLDNRSLLIYQKNLKKNKNVKIINLLNGKSLIAKTSDKANYPKFYNSVISKRIANDLEINILEPYIRLIEVNDKSTFVANEAKTFEAEKEVANKAPVEEIEIKNIGINDSKKIIKKNKIVDFKYIIKIGDFYYKNTALILQKRLYNELNIKDSKINKISKTKYRLFMGPYSNIDDLKIAHNKILNIDFETIELIKQ